ncbi:MAG: hypothetical protein ACK5LN_06245 [Propioniciclava sp.]
MALLGGGVAWAGAQYLLTGGANDGVTCTTTWQSVSGFDDRPDRYGGGHLSPDPIADCAVHAEATGKEPIVDPVAVYYQNRMVVGPRATVPLDAVPWNEWIQQQTSPNPPVRGNITRDDAAEWELERSLQDSVDGGESRCWDPKSARTFVQAELNRLGLTDWRIVDTAAEGSVGECAAVMSTVPGTIEVRAGFSEGSVTSEGGMTNALVAPLATGIPGQCLGLDEANQVAERFLAEQGIRTLVSVTLDEDASCTRVDAVVAGSISVYLYGPKTAQP